MTPTGRERAPVVLGRIPASEFGRALNVVKNPTYPCPQCEQRAAMSVYVTAVRWACGHTRSLPPLPRTWTKQARPDLIIVRGAA